MGQHDGRLVGQVRGPVHPRAFLVGPPIQLIGHPDQALTVLGVRALPIQDAPDPEPALHPAPIAGPRVHSAMAGLGAEVKDHGGVFEGFQEVLAGPQQPGERSPALEDHGVALVHDQEPWLPDADHGGGSALPRQIAVPGLGFGQDQAA